VKIHRELTVSGDPEGIDTFLARVEERSTRDATAEQRVRGLSGMYCFRCRSAHHRRAAELWICHPTPATLYAPHVVPVDEEPLGYDEYDAVVKDFYNDIVIPAADGTGVTLDGIEANAAGR